MKVSELVKELIKSVEDKGSTELIISGIDSEGFSYGEYIDPRSSVPGKYLIISPKPKHGQSIR